MLARGMSEQCRVGAGRIAPSVAALLRAGARAVHLRIAAPPQRGDCWYGVVTPGEGPLASRTPDEVPINELLGCNSVGWLDVEAQRQVIGVPLCEACYTLDYPVLPPVDDEQLELFASE